MHRSFALVALAASGLFASATVATTAETFTVCDSGCDYTSINAAIDASSDGDLIQLSAETYHVEGAIDTDGKAITIQGVADTDGDGIPETITDAGGSGRVVMCQDGEGPETIFRDLVLQNGASTTGSGMRIADSSPTIVDCVFRFNAGTNAGGAVFILRSSPDFQNCRFLDNATTASGGALALNNSHVTMAGCIIRDNSAGSNGGAIKLQNDSTIEVSDSTLCDNSESQIAGIDGFIDVGGNCITESCEDSDGDGTPDCNDGCENDPDKVEPGECGCGVPDTDSDGDGTPDCIDQCPGADDTIDSDGDGTPDCIDGCQDDPDKTEPGDCGCGVAETDSDDDGIADCIDPCPNWPYDCSDDGTTVSVAAGQSIQQAIDAVPVDGTVILEAGTHTIDSQIQLGQGGVDKPLTIIGETDSDGTPLTSIQAASGTRCFYIFGPVGPDTIIENLIITGGSGLNRGGGMYCKGDPTIINCHFLDNAVSQYGGGMYNDNGSPTLNNCTFTGNSANNGGGMYNHHSSPPLTDCTFTGNSAINGGGMYNYHSSPPLTDCTFTGNSAINGGGMYTLYGDPPLTGCTFTDNTATEGGGMHNEGRSPTLNNCTFENNSATEGGGMHNEGSSPTLNNCTFENNSATDANAMLGHGGGMYNGDLSRPTLTNCTFENNSASDIGGGMFNDESSPTLDNCAVCSNSPSQISGDYTDGGGNCITEVCDTDGDQTLDCFDQCLGEDDTIDTNGDGVPDCIDQCLGEDDTIDTDSDGTPDCADGCLNDPNKTEPGGCGCGVPEGNCHNITVAVGDSIADAVTAVASGGTIVLEAGTHIVDSQILLGQGGVDKPLTIIGETAADGTPLTSIRPRADGTRCFYVFGHVGPDTIIQNLVITGGSGLNRGAGIYCKGDPTIINCRFLDNAVAERGAGMYNDGGKPTLIHCVFTGNSAPDGGAMYNTGNSDPILTNVVICANSAPQISGDYTDGGGNCISDSCEDTDDDGIPNECEPCTGDLNADGIVNAADLGIVIGTWGTPDGQGDVNGDGTVNAADLGIVIGVWGNCP